MRSSRIILALTLAAAALTFLWPAASAQAGDAGAPVTNFKVLAPITHGNLTIFPVVAARTHDTSGFLTLDEGLRSGEVVVSEAGQVQPLIRRRHSQRPPQGDGAEVNRLVLVNNSKRPLLLLAGEIVTGGKQDRVIGKDRIIPAGSDPIDLSVFCVEPGRWQATSGYNFGGKSQMAQPSVRAKAMADKDQQKVWAEVGRANESAVEVTGVGAGSGGGIGGVARAGGGGGSYARVMDNKEVRDKIDEVAAPVQRSYEKVMRELRDQKAVGVVVAVNGELVWADLFASTDLLQKYWPKLVRSYAAEAMGGKGWSGKVTQKEAQAFLDEWGGRRQMVETEPGVYRHVEVAGAGFRAFQLTSLLPKTGFDLHLSKMADN